MATQDTIEQRRVKVADLLSQKGMMSLGELERALEVSQSTIRRDLEALEDQGFLRRTHGGAIRTRYPAAQALGFADRQTTMAREKEAIARAVAGLVRDGQTIILDGGTTCHRVAAALAGRHISVVTNSVPIASLLSAEIATEVTLIGGYLYPRTGVALGPTAVAQLEQIRASAVVMSCAGVSPEGAFNTNQMMVDVERKMMAAADRVILAVDHGKFELRGLAKLCELGELDVIVTDDGLSDQKRAWLSTLEIEVVFA
ncbi:MAG: DeoR/GlpR family DNA-binding transcription regulator [Phycisphaerae bacterium]